MRANDSASANGKSAGLGGSSNLAQLGVLSPGDAVDFWEGGSLVVKSVLICQEIVDGETYAWRWAFLDDGSLLEVSPDGFFRYATHRLVRQGSELYEELVAQDGALVRFEERVRAGESGRRPVHVTIDAKEYRLASTGTVRVQRQGAEPELIPWHSFDDKPDENVYFSLIDSADEANVVLGLWTSHVCLSFGRELSETDVTAVYRQGS